jgi:rfaE bifunctional protein nucleotidyltransferase chain/domain
MIELDFTRIHVDAVTSEHGDPLHPAVLTLEELILQFGPGKRNGRRVVFTNGCFDLLHPGHIKLLEAARAMGDALVVGLNSDESVATLKGAGRPVIAEQERAEVLANLECVDAVVVFNELTPQKTVAGLLPDILVKGGDWPGNQIVGREEVEAAGGKVVLIDVVEGHSTTEILRKIRA